MKKPTEDQIRNLWFTLYVMAESGAEVTGDEFPREYLKATLRRLYDKIHLTRDGPDFLVEMKQITKDNMLIMNQIGLEKLVSEGEKFGKAILPKAMD